MKRTIEFELNDNGEIIYYHTSRDLKLTTFEVCDIIDDLVINNKIEIEDLVEGVITILDDSYEINYKTHDFDTNETNEYSTVVMKKDLY